MARKLDKDRPYGETFHSETSDGRRYEQDNVSFDAQGNEWFEPKAGAPAPAETVLTDPAVKAAIEAEVARQVAELTAAKLPKADDEARQEPEGLTMAYCTRCHAYVPGTHVTQSHRCTRQQSSTDPSPSWPSASTRHRSTARPRAPRRRATATRGRRRRLRWRRHASGDEARV
jgi:hypothetical protein